MHAYIILFRTYSIPLRYKPTISKIIFSISLQNLVDIFFMQDFIYLYFERIAFKSSPMIRKHEARCLKDVKV